MTDFTQAALGYHQFPHSGKNNIEVDAASPQAFIEPFMRIAGTFGGITLEDSKAPVCFEIEQVLIEHCDMDRTGEIHSGRTNMHAHKRESINGSGAPLTLVEGSLL